MKLQFKHQPFQAEAAQAVVAVFKGQPYRTSSYLIDKGVQSGQQLLTEAEDFTGWHNTRVLVSPEQVLENLNKTQRANQLAPSAKLEGLYNLTIEMETGVGKTYTYIKTMYELNKAYGWCKFIVVVPSVAIREGVYQSIQMTQEHFAEQYGKKIRFFIYDSQQLAMIQSFASDDAISVMIINAQAFNARGKDARRIYMKLDDFQSRRPIDVISATHPIVIIDEPQSVEGKQTKENLKLFKPLLTLRYSATHKKDSMYNMVYRLDAMEAYNQQLVKKIAVKGISQCGTTSTQGYLYVESVDLSKSAPTAMIQFDAKGKTGVRQVTRRVKQGDNLYALSGECEEYRDGYVVISVDGRDNSVTFMNGLKLTSGDVVGHVSEAQLRRIQIRETILSHIERERALFAKGIKVLSLFFIDEVAKYKQYDAAHQAINGEYAEMFEEEYHDIVTHLQLSFGEEAYSNYLKTIKASSTHAGYFSIDKRGKMINSKVKGKESTADDVDAYDLIMKNKELLLERDPNRSPVRFIFSHSALREGWDNPNVFQICTLKQSASEVRKRQEVGRGLRLAVNQLGERMDRSVLGDSVHQVNVLTVIASESYDSFAKGLQSELAEAIADRPRAVTAMLFEGHTMVLTSGESLTVDTTIAHKIYRQLLKRDYLDDDDRLTETYYDAKQHERLSLGEELAPLLPGVVKVLDTIYDTRVMAPQNARDNNVELQFDADKFAKKEFQLLWQHIRGKTIYTVSFDTDELIRKAIHALDTKLSVPPVYFRVEAGEMGHITSKAALQDGTAFVREAQGRYTAQDAAQSSVRYDLVGKLVEATGLTRHAIIAILRGVHPETFAQFRHNPEEFILKAGRLINEQKATAIIEHITYNLLDETYDATLFTEPSIRGRLDVNAMKVNKHLYDHLVYDSNTERRFASELDIDNTVAVYVKLPDGFHIATPVGNYNPDWAIAFYEGTVKHIYFVAETKGSMDSLELRGIEDAKIRCAKKHFATISNDLVQYEVVNSYEALLEMVRK